MPHYSGGVEAKIGDMVIGQGYNVQHMIVGMVVGITPDVATCNIRVAHVRRADYGHGPIPLIDVEYGDAKAFDKVG